jgi:hypothetical protein
MEEVRRGDKLYCFPPSSPRGERRSASPLTGERTLRRGDKREKKDEREPFAAGDKRGERGAPPTPA